MLGPLAQGTATAAWAFSEPGRSWTAGGVATPARHDGEDVVLAGTKSIVQDAGAARWLLVTAELDGALVSFVADAATQRVTRRRQRVLAVTRNFCEVRPQGVRIPGARRLGDGAAGVQRALDDAAVLNSAESLGVAAVLHGDPATHRERLCSLLVEQRSPGTA